MNETRCETDRLMAFLDGALSNQDIDTLTRHLDGCPACGEKLEQLAASADRWQDVRTHLSRTTIREVTPNEIVTQGQRLPFTIRQVLSTLDPTDDPNSLGRLGGYEVAGVVGSGCMGVVLKAIDKALDRVVALKVMNPALAACGTARYRFAREAKAAAGVLHPNIIAIHGVCTDRELPFLVMPYVAGISLQQRLDRQGPLQLAEVLRIGGQLAAGLAAAHHKGLIHRDIKPANVMLDSGVETALITDFGLARTIDDATMTRTGAIAGTPEYMSPEQARGDSVDCSSDVFSLGSVLYALCTGSRPFRAQTTFGVLRRITDEQPKPIRELNPEIPEWLCKLIRQMHGKQPFQRPTSADVRDQLVACLAHVYQPDRIPLPEQLATDSGPPKSLFTRTLLPGAIVMMTLALTAILFATTQFGIPMSAGGREVATDQEVFKTHRLSFPDQQQQGRLIVDINRGFVQVEGHDSNDVLIEVLTPPQFRKSGEPKEAGLTALFTPKYDLDVNRPDNTIKFDAYNQDYELNLRIKVPYRTDLSLDSYMDGEISARNVAGEVNARSEHSDITLMGIAGSATARSRNGQLKIVFHEVSADAKLDFESYNGAIDLGLPETVKASTAIASGTSQCLTAFKIEPVEGNDRPQSILAKVKSNADEYQFGKINGGGIPLRIEAAKGKVTIRKNDDSTTNLDQ